LSTAKKFAGETFIYGLSTIASRVLTFFLTPVYTRNYSTAAYGVVTTMYSYVSMTNALLSFGMETTFFRYLNKHPDKKQRVYNNAFASVFVITILFLLFTLPFLKDIAGFIDVDHAKEMAKQGVKVTAAFGTSQADFLKIYRAFSGHSYS